VFWRAPRVTVAGAKAQRSPLVHRKLWLASMIVVLIASWEWGFGTSIGGPKFEPASKGEDGSSRPDKPSIGSASSAFVNMSDDAKQEFFSDGSMTEDIITSLSKMPISL